MTLHDNSTLARRFAASRPGRELVTIVDAALPVTTIDVDVLGQERKDLPLTEEFVLRLLDVGISEIDEMAGVLGLDRELVEMAITEQYSSGNVLYRGSTRTLALTPRGQGAVLDAKAIQPVEVPLPMTFDRLIWTATDYPRNRLIDRHDAEQDDLVMLPAAKSARPGLSDVSVERINELLKVRAEDSRIEVLTVRKVRPKRPMYLPVKLIVFADATREDVEVAVCIDGDLSPAHDAAIGQRGGASALGITLLDEKAEPPIDLPLREILETYQTQEPVAQSLGHQPHAGQTTPEEPVEEVESREGASLVDRIEMYEHADLLDEALRTARTRLLILSPWIQGSVVNTHFLSLLENRLRSKVTVHIAYGYAGPKGQSDDEDAIRRLVNLETRFAGRFSLVRLRNSHAKVLIFDQVLVTTSFNWLSFRGSRTREYRIEEGLRVRIPAVVNESYEAYLTLIHAEAAEGPDNSH